MKVLIFGCGPAGLLAAHAVAKSGGQVIILSDKKPSALHGCQYLHEPIPDLDYVPDMQMVDYRLIGTPEHYSQKVYGTRRLPVPSSPQLYAGERPAWDLRRAYAALWERYEPFVIDHHFEPETIAATLYVKSDPDLVISTIPAPVLCQKGEEHDFLSVHSWAIGDSQDEGGLRVPLRSQPFTVICDGTREVGWYRMANVFDRMTIEWPGQGPRPPIEGVVKFTKPISTTCDCWPQITRLGRYGKWQKGVLSHHVYSDVINLLNRGQ